MKITQREYRASGCNCARLLKDILRLEFNIKITKNFLNRNYIFWRSGVTIFLPRDIFRFRLSSLIFPKLYKLIQLRQTWSVKCWLIKKIKVHKVYVHFVK